MIVITLPYPPSLNTIWRRVGNKTLLSSDGRAYRQAVAAAVLQQAKRRQIAERLAVHIEAHPPDRRRRDLDNLPKSVLDGLTQAGLWLDDSQIDDLRVTRCGVFAGGALRVVVEVLP
jgi:crossover junction endodeoxyribonuclease RusA